MAKIGPVKEESLEFSQALYPESKNELKKIVNYCIKKDYPFAVPVLAEPFKLKSAISEHEYEINYVVLVFHDHCMDIINKLEI